MPRNNADRLSQSIDSVAPLGEPQSSISLSMPTEFVQLPSKGLLYPSDHPLHGKEEIEIKYMTAKEEDVLSSEALIKKGIVLDRLIQSLIIDKNIDPASLLVADRSAILVATRASGYGEEYDFSITCPGCETKTDGHYNLSEREDTSFNSEELEVQATKSGTCIVELPKTKAKIEFRLINGYDERAIIQKNSNKTNTSSIVTDQLKRLVLSINGVQDIIEIRSFIDNMPAYDSRYLRNLIADVAPNTKMSFDFICESCDHRSALEVPITLTFFWPDVGVRGKRI